MTKIEKIVAAIESNHDDFGYVVAYRNEYRKLWSGDLRQASEYFSADTTFGSITATIDIIIPVHNALPDVKLCLQRLLESSLPETARIVVVDDCSNAETRIFLQSFQPRLVEYRRNMARLGFTASVDRAIRTSNADLVAVLNSDALVTDRWLTRLAGCLMSDSSIAMVGPLSDCAAWQSVGRILGSDGRYVARWPREVDAHQIGDFLDRRHVGTFIPSELVHGFCFLLRRRDYCNAGGLDVGAFPMGYGEVQDLSLRLRARGHKIGICPSAFVGHRGTRSFSSEEKASLGREARAKLYARHGTQRYLQAETKCLLDPDLALIRSALYGVFDIPQWARNNFTPTSLSPATLLRIEETAKSRGQGIASPLGCVEVRIGREYRVVTVSQRNDRPSRRKLSKSDATANQRSLASDIARKRLLGFSPFASHRYLARHADVARSGVDAATHFLEYGAAEKRVAFEKVEISRAIAELDAQPRTPAQCSPQSRNRASIHIGVYCSSSGNQFMNVIADRLYRELKGHNFRTDLLDERSRIEQRPDLCIFVAPHEFFYIGEGRKWIQPDIIASSLMVNTEQLQETWFHMAAPYLFNSSGVIDICHQNTLLLSNAGLPATFWMPPLQRLGSTDIDLEIDHPLAEVLPRGAVARPNSPVLGRPLDLTFFGAATAHREHFFSKSARWLAQYRNMIYLRRAQGALDSKGSGHEALAVTRAATAMSKISLNIHRDEVGYFEWHRIVDIGMCNGAVVVSEHCFPNPILKAGVHYISEHPRFMPDLIDWLLMEKAGQSKLNDVRRAVDDVIVSRASIDPSTALASFIDQIHDTLRHSMERMG